jgi:hypothetical protein
MPLGVGSRMQSGLRPHRRFPVALYRLGRIELTALVGERHATFRRMGASVTMMCAGVASTCLGYWISLPPGLRGRYYVDEL